LLKTNYKWYNISLKTRGYIMVLVPAYGRDYFTEEDAKEDYLMWRDFIIDDPRGVWHGKYCSRRDFSGKTVKIMFNNKSVMTYVITPDTRT
jgi:hypothetical protein